MFSGQNLTVSHQLRRRRYYNGFLNGYREMATLTLFFLAMRRAKKRRPVSLSVLIFWVPRNGCGSSVPFKMRVRESCTRLKRLRDLYLFFRLWASLLLELLELKNGRV